MRKNNRLQQARKENGYTQEQLAYLLGYRGRQAVANWENGHAIPPLQTAIKIAEILNREVSFLFGFEVQESHTLSA